MRLLTFLRDGVERLGVRPGVLISTGTSPGIGILRNTVVAAAASVDH